MTLSTATRNGDAREARTAQGFPPVKHRVAVVFLVWAIAAASVLQASSAVILPPDAVFAPNAPAPRSTGQFLSILALIESGNERHAVGDGGRSRGAYQLSRSAWADVSRVRRAQSLTVYSWRDGAHDPIRSRLYAVTYLDLLRQRLSSALGHPPTDADVYAAYNLGFDGFRRRGFSLSRCPSRTREGARCFE